MKEQILLNGITNDIAPTLLAGYYKYGMATLITGNFGTSGGAILEIETMQELINADSNGNAKAIRACYGQCGFGSVLRGGGQGITVVMEETEPKIVGYTRDSKGKVVKRSLRDTGNTVTTFTGSGCTTDMYVAEPRISASRGRGEFKIQKYIKENPMKNEKSNIKDSSKSLSSNTELRMEDGCMVDKEGRKYRIRKLTPTECFRLMDVEDKDIEKMKQAGIAKTNLYKLAGNSICVACMFHIFRKLFIEKECENQQLELF